MREDHEKDIQVITEFLNGLMKKNLIRTDIDPHTLAKLFDALFTGIWANIIMGIDNQEIHETYIKSLTLILAPHVKPQR